MTALAQERDLLAVWRPRRALIADVAFRDYLRFLGGDGEDADVVVEVLQIAFAILLEVIAIDHDRRRGLPLPALEFLGFVGRILVLGNERDARAVGRPLDVGHAALEVADALRFKGGVSDIQW